MSDSYAKINEAADNTRHGGKALVAISFLAGVGLGLMLLGGGGGGWDEEPAITMAQQFMQASKMQPIMARPIATQSSRKFMGPVAASASEDAPVALGRREALAAGVGTAFSIASRPVFAAEKEAVVAAAPAIAPFPVKGDPKQSINKIATIITKDFGSGLVTEKTATTIKANLFTSERVLTADLGYGEKLKVGEQRVQHLWKDKVEFTYNPGTNAIDVALKDVPSHEGGAFPSRPSSSKPGLGAKIVERYRVQYLTGSKPGVGAFLYGPNPNSQQSTSGTRIMRTPKDGTVLPKGLS